MLESRINKYQFTIIKVWTENDILNDSLKLLSAIFNSPPIIKNAKNSKIEVWWLLFEAKEQN